MSLFAALNGRIISKGEIRIPMLGNWDADLDVQDGAAASGVCSVVVAGLTLAAFIRRGAPWHGVFRAALCGGKGGWSREIPPAGYRSLTGVKASTVANDAARAVGESVMFRIDSDFIVGNTYTRTRCPASRVLALLDRPWYMRPDGVTVVGDRPGGIVASNFDVIDGSPERGLYTIATEHPEDFVPGKTFSSAQVPSTLIRGVVHHIEAGSLRTEVWAP